MLLLAAAFGLIFDDGAVRERIIQTVFDNVPLADGDDRPTLERTVNDALRQAGELGIFTTLLLIAAASGVMGALRHSINEAWDIEQRPPLLKRKALDFALILGGTSILALSVSLTVTHRLASTSTTRPAGGWLWRRCWTRRRRAADRLRPRAAVRLPRAADEQGADCATSGRARSSAR